MTKYIFIILFFAACSVEEPTPTPAETESPDCACGEVIYSGIIIDGHHRSYWYDIKNYCTREVKRIYTTKSGLTEYCNP